MTRLMTEVRPLTTGATAIDALAAPSRNGGLLIEPSADVLMTAAQSNRALRRTYDFRLLDRPASAWLSERTRDDAPLVVMPGHQPEFIHPGVWIKHVFAQRLAERLGGEMRFLVVDSDVPVVIRLDWPVLRDGHATLESERAAAVMNWRSYEYIRDREGIDYTILFDVAKRRFAGAEDTPLAAFAAAMTAPHPAGAYVDRWIAGLTACDASLGIPTSAFVPVSRLFDFSAATRDDAAAAFVAHIVIHAHDFRASYNGALAAYRSRRDIAGVRHPIPDLDETQRRIETPFWLTHPEHGRERLYATPCERADCVTLFAGATPLAEIRIPDLVAAPANTLAAALGEWGVRPRALAQTLYARIFACDLFLHGIGGAKYDQITDDLIRDFFGVRPPAYGCVSATLRLALPTFDATNESLDGARRERRDLSYNPQRYLTDAQRPAVAHLLEERQRAIEASGRLRAKQRDNRQARKAAFDRIHAANQRILDTMTTQRASLDQRIAHLSREIAHNRVAANREWFFALYTTQQLRELRDEAWRTIDDATP